MSTNEKLVAVVTMMERATELGKLNWTETELTNVFQASFPRYSIRLFPRAGSTGEDVIVQI